MASPKQMLYAWARPVSFAEWAGDHTFVTDYDQPFKDNPPRRSWYCAGGVYSRDSNGVRPLLSAEADIKFAEFICTPDDPEKREWPEFKSTAGIEYGINGVCHHIANRILYAAQSSGPPPLVNEARGYKFHEFVYMLLGYGQYGTNEPQWRDRLARYR